MSNFFRTLSFLALIVITSLSFAQRPATGAPPFSTLAGSPDVINLGNLNVHYGFPILRKPGRGLSFSYTLGYDSSIWQAVQANGSSTWMPAQNWGWQADSAASIGYIETRDDELMCWDGDSWAWYTRQTITNYVDQGGTQHPIGITFTHEDCSLQPRTATASATDGSGIVMTATEWQEGEIDARVAFRDGSVADLWSPQTITDSNGNFISYDLAGHFTDTLGMNVLTITGTAPDPVSYTYTDSSGTPRSVVVNYTNYTVQTNFGAPGIGEYGPQVNPLVTSIVYPDGSQYSFTYEDTPGFPGAVTGRIASVTLPTGGTISYAYSYTPGHGYNGIWKDGSTTEFTRTTSDGSWTYSSRPHFSCTASGTPVDCVPKSPNDTSVTDPQGNQAVYTFSGLYETQRSFYQGTIAGGTLLKRIFHCYNGNTTSCETATATPPITNKFDYTIVDNIWFTQGYAFNNYGLLMTAEDYYDGVGGNGALRRRTTISYAALGNNIVDHQWVVTVYDGYGNPRKQTAYSYDESNLTSTSVPQHVSVTGSRGNVTTKWEWLSANGPDSPVTKYTYDDTGNVISATDPGGHTASYSYGVNNAYLMQVTMPATGTSHVTSATYVGYTGQIATSTDENNQTTSYTYNAMLRPLTVSYPNGGQTTITYVDANTTLTQQKIDASGRQSENWVQIDGYGRPSRTAVFNGESVSTAAYDNQSFCYSPQGGQTFATYPYQSSGWIASNPPCSVSGKTINKPQPGDTTTYDALGRTLNVTHSDGSSSTFAYKGRAVQTTDEGNGNGTHKVNKIYQTDGLGLLTSVCEVSDATLVVGSGNVPLDCGQDIAATGFFTAYEYDLLGNLTAVHQNGVADRTFQYDSLSRLTSETAPETFGNTTSYTYDHDGQLIARVRPAPNQGNAAVTATTNYSYDVLHRITGRTYSDGTTATNGFYYDYSTIWGHPSGNASGRLSAETSNLNGLDQAEEVFWNYDAMGRPQGTSQCTPRVCYTADYNFQYTYDLLGNLTSETDGVGVTSNYTYNGAPRITGVTNNLSTANYPGTLLSGVTYGIAGPTASTLGDGLAETRTYDPRLGLKKYSAGNTYSYDLTKAANGNVTAGNDSANGAWSYSYDPFNRLASASKSGQSFAYDYDRFGNRWNQKLTTTGSSAQQPSYTFDGYNHITNSGFSYDALGNVTNDGVHAYTYDAENRVTQVDGGATAAYTYDAEGRRVKAAKAGGVSSEFLYDLNGRAITELDGSSGNFKRGKVFAGGLHIATYTDSTTYFYHRDWLGTKRVSTDPTGAVVETCTNLPFGDGGSCTGANASLISFTDFDHDPESNLEHAWFRQLSTSQGRWMTQDPYSGSMDLSNPQSLNRYAHASNNPINFFDPLGLDVCPPGTEGVGSTGTCVSVNGGGGRECNGDCLAGNGTGLGEGTNSGPGFPQMLNYQTVPVLVVTKKTTAQRLACAARFGTDHSIAAAFGAQDNFVAGLFGGNTVSSLVNLGLFVSGDKTPTASDVGKIMLKGGAQGIPIPRGNPVGLSGVAGQLRGMAVQGAVNATFNAFTGAGAETIELGLTASGTIATSTAQLSAETLGQISSGIGTAKFVFDVSTFAYGYFFMCGK